MTPQKRCQLERRCLEIERELQELGAGRGPAEDTGAAKREAELLRELSRIEREMAQDQPGRRGRSDDED
ncbi:MAG: hypothetical protein JXB13_03070 [Phycisphaerae bacterium]|nr:hypothetical protein [Phycisphaerae bacterium]